ncbi:MAG: glutathione S-transferase family protein [Alphaproteobacteria bacterium]
MKLYTWLSAPNPRRATMFVAEKEIDIDIVEASDPENPSQLSASFCAKHPHRRFRLLELDDGDWIGEATAICRFLETLYPETPLMGRDPKEAAQIEMWDRLAEWEELMAVSEVFRNTHRLFVDRGLAGYDVAIPQIPDLAKRGELRLGRFFDKIDEQLGKHEFLAGEAFSFADITALCAIDFGISRRLSIPGECVNVRRWHDAVSSRSSARM